MHPIIKQQAFSPRTHHTSDCFYDDMVSLFSETAAGHVGKYIYGKDEAPTISSTDDNDLWNGIVKNSTSYYIPLADHDLVTQAASDLPHLLPRGLTYVDFGIGSAESLLRYTLPTLHAIQAQNYLAVDHCQSFLKNLDHLSAEFRGVKAASITADFFQPQPFPFVNKPSLGVMTGITVTNYYGGIKDRHSALLMSQNLQRLSHQSGDGWMLLTTDCNQDERSLMDAYVNPLNSKLYLNVLFRANNALPMQDFDPSLFVYAPEWHPETRLFAHMAMATENQDFRLGPHRFSVRKGDKLHLLNSYKFNEQEFETCCHGASLDVVKRWDHSSPMRMYLLQSKKIQSAKVLSFHENLIN